jgi:hypothetical protein
MHDAGRRKKVEKLMNDWDAFSSKAPPSSATEPLDTVSAPQPRRRKSGQSRKTPPSWRIILLGLAVLLIAALVGGITWFAMYHASGTHAASPSAIAVPTVTPGTYATVFSQGSATDPAQMNTASSTPIECPSFGSYSIVNVDSGLALDVPNGSVESSAIIIQYQNSGGNSKNQQWQFVSTSRNYYKIVNVNSGLVLDVPWGSNDSGVAIIQYGYSGSLNQQWQCFSIGKNDFKIVNANSSMVLEVPSIASYAPLLQGQYTGSSNQQWQLVLSGA